MRALRAPSRGRAADCHAARAMPVSEVPRWWCRGCRAHGSEGCGGCVDVGFAARGIAPKTRRAGGGACACRAAAWWLSHSAVEAVAPCCASCVNCSALGGRRRFLERFPCHPVTALPVSALLALHGGRYDAALASAEAHVRERARAPLCSPSGPSAADRFWLQAPKLAAATSSGNVCVCGDVGMWRGALVCTDVATRDVLSTNSLRRCCTWPLPP